jgi:hypothetical protein
MFDPAIENSDIGEAPEHPGCGAASADSSHPFESVDTVKMVSRVDSRCVIEFEKSPPISDVHSSTDRTRGSPPRATSADARQVSLLRAGNEITLDSAG